MGRDILTHPTIWGVTAAGNSRSARVNDDPLFGDKTDGYDLMLGFNTSKNSLIVAAAQVNVDNSNGEIKRVDYTTYSSYGPTDDGRIKPDITGDGTAINAPTTKSISSYAASTGTSMATPGVTGSLALLQEYYHQLNDKYMLAASLKGLALHTADDIFEPGPDYKLGWGIINTKKAAQLIQNDEYSAMIIEDVLVDGEVFELDVSASGDVPLQVSISWTDPPQEQINSGIANDPTAVLVADLDVKLLQQNATHLPWKLVGSAPELPAFQGVNNLDPYERVDVTNPKGEYKIYISHKDSLALGKQPFSLIVSGIKTSECSTESPVISLSDASANSVYVNWEATPKLYMKWSTS